MFNWGKAKEEEEKDSGTASPALAGDQSPARAGASAAGTARSPGGWFFQRCRQLVEALSPSRVAKKGSGAQNAAGSEAAAGESAHDAAADSANGKEDGPSKPDEPMSEQNGAAGEASTYVATSNLGERGADEAATGEASSAPEPPTSAGQAATPPPVPEEDKALAAAQVADSGAPPDPGTPPEASEEAAPPEPQASLGRRKRGRAKAKDDDFVSHDEAFGTSAKGRGKGKGRAKGRAGGKAHTDAEGEGSAPSGAPSPALSPTPSPAPSAGLSAGPSAGSGSAAHARKKGRMASVNSHALGIGAPGSGEPGSGGPSKGGATAAEAVGSLPEEAKLFSVPQEFRDQCFPQRPSQWC